MFGQSVTFTATVNSIAPSTLTPLGTVTFFNVTTSMTLGTQPVNAQGAATLVFADLATGSNTIQATFKPSDGYATSVGHVVQVVNAAHTTTTITSSKNPSSFGDSVTLTAFISAAPSAAIPTGSVTFTIDGHDVGSVPVGGTGSASFTTAGLAIGTHAVVAQYFSDSTNFTSSTSPGLAQQVNLTITTTLSSSDASSLAGQAVTFTAVVSAPEGGTPSGTVTFKVDDGGAVVVAVNGLGQASFTTASLTPGVHTITADYTSDISTFANSSATPLTQTVSSLAVPGTQTAFEDVDKAISGIIVGRGRSSLTVTLSVGHGTLTLAGAAGVIVSGNGSGVVTLTGGIADLNARWPDWSTAVRSTTAEATR